ncbi:hypothetical protein EVAR_75914_1 [Eumeta japonica]|uniref:Uncharacterized protein n=1 Tax=Eumeta variegata TaxID=151549 RepID=A0A4C1UXI5_EUMVA|nr:hypothetical protein EVAR_75914_1 [Eumeta japonica]
MVFSDIDGGICKITVTVHPIFPFELRVPELGSLGPNDNHRHRCDVSVQRRRLKVLSELRNNKFIWTKMQSVRLVDSHGAYPFSLESNPPAARS